MNRQHKILVFNVHSTLNGGDRALLECTITQIKDHFQNADITILANFPYEPFYQENHINVLPSVWICSGVTQRKPIWKQILAAGWGWLAAFLEGWFGLRLAQGDWRKLFDAYHQSDLIVGVAGNQYYSTGRYGWPFPITALAPALGHIFKKPVYIMPQSIGPLKRKWERVLLRSIYANNRLILLRDAVSMQLAKEINLPKEKIKFFPDIAFDYSPSTRQEALDILGKYGFKPDTPSVGATIIADPGRSQPPGGIEAYYAAMAEVLKRLGENYGLPIYLFIQVSGPTSQEDDRLGISQVLERLGDKKKYIHFVNEILTPAQLKACYGCMELFLPTRMHSGIFAMTMNVPCIFIGYLTKTRGMMEAIGLQDWMLQVGSVDTEELWLKVANAWKERKERSAHLATIIPQIITECRKAGSLIAEDFALDVE
jgi:colanic acid/amylovoran biosynthesis protein